MNKDKNSTILVNEAKRKPKKAHSQRKGSTKKEAPAKTASAPKTKGKGKKKGKAADEEDVTRKEVTQFGVGILFIVMGLFLITSIISYLFVGQIDQQAIQDGSIPANWMGKLGAWSAYYFVDKCYGVPVIFFPIFLLACGVRVMGIMKVRLWKWFINCGILMLWFCLLGGYLMSFDWYTDLHTHINLGGAIGEGLYKQIHDKIGGFFVVTLILTAIGYLTYLSTETIRIIKRSIEKPVQFVREHIVDSDGDGDDDDAEDDAEVIVPGEDTQAAINTATNMPTGLEEAIEGESDGPIILPEDDYREPIEREPYEERDTATTIEFDMPLGDASDKSLNDRTLFDNNDLELTVTVASDEADALDENGDAKLDETTTESNNIPAGMKVNQGEALQEASPNSLGELEPYDPKLDLENYHYPTLDLLKRYEVQTNVDMEEQQANKNQILTVLSNFGVEISSIKATVGPTITLYEVTPAPGVRINKIRNLEDDIALSLRALGIRIIAPIPGKGTIGIEVPNARPQIVSMESIINSRKFQDCDYELPIALGKTITNDVFLVDLAKMPHLLVAGATGQGKSVGLNAIITSLLYKKHPAELKLVMVDPKKVEFSVYNPIVNHFLAQVEGNEESEEPIICDVTKVIQTLKSLCVEMDTRYDLLKKARARNVKEYNQKFRDRMLNPNNGHKFMPYIVVIIDEFGDLIMTAGKEIEMPIARIAQLARAVGIHMIIATQRPTTNIITGTIKANFPARMAFKVSAMVDSRTILDRPGANQLVGKGDMLFLAGNDPVRVQCAFVDTPEVELITNYIAQQQSYLSPFPLPPVPLDGEEGGGANDVDMNNLDPMFEEVARMVVYENSGSTSMIQRKFSIGYNRAGRLMDQLEKAGIVGPAKGSKPREVLCVSEDDLQFRIDALRH